jgi:hypothetical protein
MTRRGRPPTGRPFAYAVRIYQAMAARSVPLSEAPPEVQALAAPDQVTPEARVFVGGLVALFEDYGLRSRAQYHATKGHLVAMGALTRLRRGNGRVAAVWLLGPEPTIGAWAHRVEQPANVQRVLAVETEHHLRLAAFLHDLPTVAPTLAEELRMAGCRTVADVLGYLRTLPLVRLAGLGPGACLHFIDRREHSCGMERAGLQAVQPHPAAQLVD